MSFYRKAACLAAAALVLFPVFRTAEAAGGETDSAAVLLVYSSGEPFKDYSEIKGPEDLEAVSSPTPREMNVRRAALRIREVLEDRGIAVRLASVEEITDWRQIMDYEVIVIGSATRFWNMTWECKRFFDRHFFRIYQCPDKAQGKTFVLFTRAEIIPSGERTLAAMKAVIGDCKGEVAGPGLIMLDEWTTEKADAELERFGRELAELVESGK